MACNYFTGFGSNGSYADAYVEQSPYYDGKRFIFTVYDSHDKQVKGGRKPTLAGAKKAAAAALRALGATRISWTCSPH